LDRFNLVRARKGIFSLANGRYEKEEKLRICVENYDLFDIFDCLNALDNIFNDKSDNIK
jgi:hypothetical protein